jgi:hypothetical protein
MRAIRGGDGVSALLANRLRSWGAESGASSDSLARGESRRGPGAAESCGPAGLPVTRYGGGVSRGMSLGAFRHGRGAAFSGRGPAVAWGMPGPRAAASLGKIGAALDTRAENEGSGIAQPARPWRGGAGAGDRQRAVMAVHAAAESFLKHALGRDFPGPPGPQDAKAGV